MFKAIEQAVKDLPWAEIGTAFIAGAVVAVGVLAGRKIVKVAKTGYKAAVEKAKEETPQAS